MSFLKKKSEAAPASPSVSSLPVPPSDSALVIDLPEGQKLVLGKMAEGTVIEVATWRGTGRPDSRTNRLMLGVSFGGNQVDEEKQEASVEDQTFVRKSLQILKVRFRFLVLFVQNVSRFLAPRINNVSTLIRRRIEQAKSRKAIKSNISFEDQMSVSDSEVDIEKWLESIRSKSRTRALMEGEKTGSLESSPKKRSSDGPRSGKKVRKRTASRPKKG